MAFLGSFAGGHVLTDVRQDEEHGGVVVGLAVGSEQLLRKLAVRERRLGELFFQPGLHLLVVAFLARPRQQPGRPEVRPVLSVVIALGVAVVAQQPFDQERSPGVGRVAEIVVDLRRLGDAANDVERDAANELVVVDAARRRQLVRLPGGCQRLVDEPGLFGDI